ncbi:17-beta-hydroxysteroid dehydrogenase [Lecanosticta acicola]|uniref:17-beta-hydroxysteroid dehydrogenase n=1 Tax=Lecanosticta acicola TaxID=111012 RepID=A0AAI9EFD3_9PEZI|nr:17-beta-hydroxysteroid dehydrogenase [Lecanosticta acicola]
MSPAALWQEQQRRPYSLDGKVALVTGSGRGIGAAMAVELGRCGAKVVVNYSKSYAPAEKVVDQIRGFGGSADAVAIQADVSDVSQTIALFEKAVEHFGEVNIVCSNSGVVSFGHLEDVTEEEFDRVFRLNTRGQFFVAREAYKHLGPGGRIILMSSNTTRDKIVPNHSIYAGSKGAVESFVRCLALDCGRKKITVNAVAPGATVTDMFHETVRKYVPNGQNLSDEEIEEFASASDTPLSRPGRPEDIARVVCFLASEEGEWINGKTIPVDGAA